ncbi:YdiU family protein [Beggiatoa alba]|nr:YdiU family protein [Beggiatoa alba]
MKNRMKHSLATLPFSNTFASLADTFYSRVQPTPFDSKSYLIHFNSQAAALLDLDPDEQHSPDFVSLFSGHTLPAKADPIAMLYSGHQFGHYVEQLGDGRAIMIGETTNQLGQKWEMQLKGSGMTPYSRQADGRAVLRSSIREYLCSEAMHGLGIPTTRALCIIGNNDKVYREQIETAAIVTRLAPSHIRFGSFEVFFYRNQLEQIKTLADFVIQHHYPVLQNADNPYIELLKTVIDKTAKLIAQWQAVGFAHGVMNSDNMSILGLTLDYGPFGFLDAYNPNFICNHSDHKGRYAFDQQPQIGLFNLSCLAQALLPLIDVGSAQAALATYQDTYIKYYHSLMANKLGFTHTDTTVEKLNAALLEQMHQSSVDYTLFFRTLSNTPISTDTRQTNSLRDMFLDRTGFDQWLANYIKHFDTLSLSLPTQQEKMLQTNPRFILRNYMAQIAIEKAEREQDYSEIDKLITVLQSPYDEHPGMAHYTRPPPDWASTLSVSCSS